MIPTKGTDTEENSVIQRRISKIIIFLAETETAEAESPRLQNQSRLAIRFTAFGDGRINHNFVLNFVAAVKLNRTNRA